MKLIYGSTFLANQPALVETEKTSVARMQAALSAYPWEATSLCGLAGACGCGVFGVQAGEKASAPGLVPTLGELTIAADVRMDNRSELYAGLALSAAEGAGLDDAGLILRAYQEWGEACASHQLGDFSFAIVDPEKNRRLLA